MVDTIMAIFFIVVLAVLVLAIIAWPVILLCVFWPSMVTPWNTIALIAVVAYWAFLLAWGTRG